MLKIVSFTRILNEDDIVEAFVRHHAAHVDEMLFLDYGSTDNTLDILSALREEGFLLRVFQSHAVNLDEMGATLWGYQLASQVMNADFVLFLEADEFIATHDSRPLSTLLPGDSLAIRVNRMHYGMVGDEDEAELIVPRRLQWRLPAFVGPGSVFVRSKIPNLLIAPGASTILLNGQPLPATEQDKITLAQYTYRSGWQAVQKYSLTHLRGLATGGPGAQTAALYAKPFEQLCDNTDEVLQEPVSYQDFNRSEAIEAPLNYLGGSLSYTVMSCSQNHALSEILHYAARLARQHGKLQDELTEARHLVEHLNRTREPFL